MKTDNKLSTCPSCKGSIETGKTIFSVELTVGVLIVRNVPASICIQCGEKFISDDVMEILENIAVDARKRHAQIEVVEFHDVA